MYTIGHYSFWGINAKLKTFHKINRKKNILWKTNRATVYGNVLMCLLLTMPYILALNAGSHTHTLLSRVQRARAQHKHTYSAMDLSRILNHFVLTENEQVDYTHIYWQLRRWWWRRSKSVFHVRILHIDFTLKTCKHTFMPFKIHHFAVSKNSRKHFSWENRMPNTFHHFTSDLFDHENALKTE